MVQISIFVFLQYTLLRVFDREGSEYLLKHLIQLRKCDQQKYTLKSEDIGEYRSDNSLSIAASLALVTPIESKKKEMPFLKSSDVDIPSHCHSSSDVPTTENRIVSSQDYMYEHGIRAMDVYNKEKLNEKNDAKIRARENGPQRYLQPVDILVTISKNIVDALSGIKVARNTCHTRNRLKEQIEGYLDGVRSSGKIHNFSVVMNDVNNPAEVIDNNCAVMDISIKPTRKSYNFINRYNLTPAGLVHFGKFRRLDEYKAEYTIDAGEMRTFDEFMDEQGGSHISPSCVPSFDRLLPPAELAAIV